MKEENREVYFLSDSVHFATGKNKIEDEYL